MAPSDTPVDRAAQVRARVRSAWFHYWQVSWLVGGAITAALLVLGLGWSYEALEAPFFVWFITHLVVVDLFAPRNVAPERWRSARWFVAGELLLAGVFVLNHASEIVG